ncbi:MAG: GTPase ObgE [Planctomycetota bacterium]
MFIDEATIEVFAGNGGDGRRSFRREKYMPKGGPDGGDGGRGADIVFVADPNANTLLDFRGRHHWRAAHGEHGGSSSKHGKGAADMVIRVPPGTVVFDEDAGETVADLAPGEQAVIAKGGDGGFGNERFKSATNQAPTQTTPGGRGEHKRLKLELKLIADVGLVGKPNAGKSTLLSVVTHARPKVADYPFTTLEPQLGIAELDPARRLVFADIPGLIEGAADGAGLGHEFLRHIERTRVLVHLLDAEPTDGTSPAENYRAIRAELAGYAPALAEKPEVVCLNKLDLMPEDEADAAVKELRAELELGHDTPVLGLSGATAVGTRELLEAVWAKLGARERPGWGG